MRRPPKMKSAAAAAAIVALLAAGASACASSSGSGTTASTGGTLTIQGDAGTPTLTENFNPLQPATELHGTYLIYEPLEIPSPVNGSYTPFLATGYQFTNPTTLVYTIRQGVKWSDGTPFTPADVVFTFNLLKKNPGLDGNGVWSQISGVSASGNDVTIRFKAPNVPFAGIIAQTPIVPQHVWSKIADPVKFTNTHPVGTGPFVLSKFAPTQYTLAKNKLYWNASKIAPSTVVFPAEASNQSTNQLAVSSGQFDWSYTFLPDVKKTYVDRDPAHNQYWFPPGGTIGLYLNLTKAPFTSVDFRRGLSLALNRTAIAQKAVNGYMAQASLSGLILPNLSKWLDPSLPDQGQVSQSKPAALAAFAKAGYTMRGGNLTSSNGTKASLTIVLPNSFSDWVAAATEVKNELTADGITVTLDLPQYAQYSQEIQAGTFDAAIGGFGGTGSPYTDFNNALNSTYAAPINTPTANNFERFKSPAVNQALATLASSTSTATQQQATDKLELMMYNTVPIVLLYYGGSWGLFSTKHFTGWPSASDPYTLPTNYNNALLTVVTHLRKA
ncbi:MAG TPA: ABC transporter substrate-binding protein [Streptosporangiaceae bacterium]|nr:ABC transporter substrate-binding protein [Streptosporangiaceae bacterium]HVB45424.1 ABC transporter substrate-binding protein [Streptosporangiaceae bacterium]